MPIEDCKKQPYAMEAKDATERLQIRIKSHNPYLFWCFFSRMKIPVVSQLKASQLHRILLLTILTPHQPQLVYRIFLANLAG